jgi:hypothetical protein
LTRYLTVNKKRFQSLLSRANRRVGVGKTQLPRFVLRFAKAAPEWGLQGRGDEATGNVPGGRPTDDDEAGGWRTSCDNPPRKILYYHLNQSTLVIKR